MLSDGFHQALWESRNPKPRNVPDIVLVSKRGELIPAILVWKIHSSLCDIGTFHSYQSYSHICTFSSRMLNMLQCKTCIVLLLTFDVWSIVGKRLPNIYINQRNKRKKNRYNLQQIRLLCLILHGFPYLSRSHILLFLVSMLSHTDVIVAQAWDGEWGWGMWWGGTEMGY